MDHGVRPRTVQVAAGAFAVTLALVTPITAALVGSGPLYKDPGVVSALVGAPLLVGAWLWSQKNPQRAGQLLTIGMALTAWLFTYLIQGSGYLVGNYAYLAVIVVAAAFLVSVRFTVAITAANIGVVIVVWSTTGLGVTDLVLSLAYQVLFGVLLIGLARHLERARNNALSLAEQLGRSKEATESVLASSWDAIVVMEDGAIKGLNRQAEHWLDNWFGRTVDYGTPLGDVFGGMDALLHLVDEAHRLGDAMDEIKLTTPRGERIVMARAVTEGLGHQEALFMRDVTDERAKQAAERERLRQEMELHTLQKQQEWQRHFMNMASHELRTPLTPIRIQMEMLKGSKEPGIDVVDRNVRRLEALIDDIMEVVKLEQHDVPLDIQDVDLASVVARQLEHWLGVAEAKGLHVESSLPEGIWVQADEKRLGQIIDNMVCNAVKYTERGDVRIALERRPEGIVLTVADTGSGFDPADAERVFDPFVRLDHHLQQEGTGLGMSICRSFATAMHGEMQAASPGVGLGATFMLRLPAATP